MEVRLKNRTLWGYRSTYPYGHRKGVPPPPHPPGYLPNLGPIEFLWQKFSAFFSATISLRKFPSSQQTKIWLLWQFPFPLCYDDIYDDTSAKPCTRSEAINKLAVTILKLSGKKASKYKSEGNFSHIKKLLMACEILAWWASHNDKNSEISLYALISNATGLHV